MIKIKWTKENIIKKAKEIHGNKYDYSLITEEWWQENYKNTYTKLPIICPEHGKFEQQLISHIKKGHGCKLCGRIQNIKTHKKNKKNQLKLKNFLKRAKEIHGDKYDYSLITEDFWQKNYKHNQKTKVPIICKKHNIFYQTIFDHLQGHGCPKCNESKGERKIRQYLEKNNINYIYQYKIKYQNKFFYFDFYIPELNLAIEYDGIFHFESPSEIFESEVQKQKERDELKNQYCQENNINLLRIPYWDFKKIDEILNQALKKA